VTVEGHTDSTGGQNLNQHLSERRAEAVTAYLVANNVLPAERLKAVGKAYSEPLAPNTTAEGRALNRRIDLIIEPRAALPNGAAGGSDPLRHRRRYICDDTRDAEEP
jgi:outer membrane protein OmpA-like peptidoglycan-associated protein